MKGGNYMKVIKIINKNKTYLDKGGKTHLATNYYLELDNGAWVPFRPSFSKGYTQLDAVCETIINETKSV